MSRRTRRPLRRESRFCRPLDTRLNDHLHGECESHGISEKLGHMDLPVRGLLALWGTTRGYHGKGGSALRGVWWSVDIPGLGRGPDVCPTDQGNPTAQSAGADHSEGIQDDPFPGRLRATVTDCANRSQRCWEIQLHFFLSHDAVPGRNGGGDLVPEALLRAQAVQLAGLERFRAYVWSAIVPHNLAVLARSRLKLRPAYRREGVRGPETGRPARAGGSAVSTDRGMAAAKLQKRPASKVGGRRNHPNHGRKTPRNALRTGIYGPELH